MKRELHFATKLNSRDIQRNLHVQSLLQAQEEGVPRMRPLRVEFMYTVSRGQGIITCNRDWWEGVWGVWREVICHRKVQQSFLNQSLDPLDGFWAPYSQFNLNIFKTVHAITAKRSNSTSSRVSLVKE